MKINKKLITRNFTKGRAGNKVEYIVIHDTGNPAKTATADAHYRYFSGPIDRKASAHYFVDEKEIIQIIEDHDTAWHVGDGRGKNGIWNNNSIGIEICINDGEYTKEILDTIDLVIYLMKLHNVPFSKVVRHFDASGKNCPNVLSKNNWQGWADFKALLRKRLAAAEKKEEDVVKVNIKGKLYRMEGLFKDDKNYVSIRELAEALGFEVGWDQGNKTVIIK